MKGYCFECDDEVSVTNVKELEGPNGTVLLKGDCNTCLSPATQLEFEVWRPYGDSNQGYEDDPERDESSTHTAAVGQVKGQGTKQVWRRKGSKAKKG